MSETHFSPRNLSIRLKATLLIFVIVLVSLSVSTAINVSQTNKLIAEEQKRSAEAIAHGLAQAVELPMVVRDMVELNRLLDGFLWNKEVQFLLILDDQGEIMARRILNREAFASFTTSGESPTTLLVSKPVYFRARGMRSARLENDEQDLLNEPKQMGQVLVALSLVAAKKAQRSQALVSLFTAGLAAAFSVFLVFRPVGRWNRRLRDLVLAADRMKQGDFDHPVQSCSDDEIGRLAATFEAMRKAVGDRDKELREFNNTLHDLVSERTEKLENAMLKAQTASEAKSSFLANMSHEIRTPMNGIIGMVNLALNQKVSPKLREYLLTVRSSAESLLAIINDILDFSKIEAGKITVENVDFQLHQLFDKLSDLFSVQAAIRNIELIIGIEPGVPAALHGDPLRLEQIFINLLGNALKYTDSGEIIVHATIDFESDDSTRILFSVTDTGVGIDNDQLGMLFDPFTQADGSTTREYGGTGLGLSICKRLVELLDGEIWVKTQENVGTSIFFTAEFGRQSEDKEVQYVVPATIRGLRILVIDDNETAKCITANMLESFYFNVDIASSCDEAEGYLKRSDRKYDLILLDWQMPMVDGVECIGRIKTMSGMEEIPIIMMTAFGSELEMIQAREKGVKHFLTKPLKQSLLFDTIMDVFHYPEAMHASLDGRDQTINVLSTFHLTGVRVLVAEDNRINQNVARELLESGGIIVEIANNGQEAVSILKDRGEEFDAVLMDVQMPVVDGFEATKMIRTNPVISDLPIIAVTAHAMQGDREKCMKAGMNDYVTKPITPVALFRILTRWIRPEYSRYEDLPPQLKIYQDGMANLPETLPGLQIHSGVARMAGNVQSYMQMLKDLLQFGRDVEVKLGSLIVNDLPQAIREIHTLKGTAANLSAHQLQNSALQLERLLKRVESGEAGEDTLKKLDSGSAFGGVRIAIAQLAVGVEELADLLRQEDFERSGNNQEGVDILVLIKILRHLYQFIGDFDPMAEEYWLGEKGKFKGLGVEEEITRMENHLRNYNFEKAGDFVVRICDQLSEDVDML